MADNIQIFCDFNIHMEKYTDPLQKAFRAIIDSVGFVQHVFGPTHCHSPGSPGTVPSQGSPAMVPTLAMIRSPEPPAMIHSPVLQRRRDQRKERGGCVQNRSHHRE